MKCNGFKLNFILKLKLFFEFIYLFDVGKIYSVETLNFCIFVQK